MKDMLAHFKDFCKEAAECERLSLKRKNVAAAQPTPWLHPPLAWLCSGYRASPHEFDWLIALSASTPRIEKRASPSRRARRPRTRQTPSSM